MKKRVSDWPYYTHWMKPVSQKSLVNSPPMASPTSSSLPAPTSSKSNPLPVLGTGKMDLRGLKRIAMERLSEREVVSPE